MELPAVAELQAAAAVEGPVGARGEEPPRAVEKVERVAAEPQVAARVTAGRPSSAAAGVAAEPRPGEALPVNARHNISRIYFPLEMTCDNSGI